MHHDTVDRTIRNQRYRVWPPLAVIGGWTVIWLGIAIVVERELTPAPNFWVTVAFLVATAASFAGIMALFGRFEQVKRLKLGDEVRTSPSSRFAPKDIRVISFAADPREDYVEQTLPIPLCELTIARQRGRLLKLIVSLGDASRVREWAEQHGVPVDDPQKYSSRINEPETRQ
jgi:hypothetical protein